MSAVQRLVIELIREGPQVCFRDFNENDVGLSSQVYLSEV
jgi:hypothetical protein